ncbi:MAG: Ni/Fe-hydrogenase cytochrome b subunit [Deltaproteobacteria bacterium]|nr:Ni/Fe-hydrogenase cytochrome b subunit [Deltaproteobacteria bacterium]
MNPRQPAPVRRPLFTTGTLVLLTLMAVGYAFALARFFAGLGAITNLSDRYPWGLWIALKGCCVALAAGGFTTAALVEVFGRPRYRPLLRSAILTAWLCYTMLVLSLLFDLGRYWNIWRPIFWWQGNSVLFEVGICVMAYLAVLTVELAPAWLEGIQQAVARVGRARRRPWLERSLRLARTAVRVALPLFVLAGVVLSCMHQSSFGALMVIAPTKLDPFWYTPLLPLQFLASAIMVGFPMVIVESIASARSLRRPVEMSLLTPLARWIPWFIAVYAGLRLGDLAWRADRLDWLARPTATTALAVELLVGIGLPFCALLARRVRESTGLLFAAALCVVVGVAINRVNVFVVGYTPPHAAHGYFPALGEIAVTVAIVCTIAFLYRLVVTYLPVLTASEPTPRVAGEPLPRVAPTVEWALRGAAAGLLVLFAVVYAVVHEQSIASSQTTRAPASAVVRAPPPTAAPDIARAGRPRDYRTFFFLNDPGLNAAIDDYQPVRFSHRSHDNASRGNCAACHHRHARDGEDRIGIDLVDLHRDLEIHLGPACSACHGDAEQNRPLSCGHCHRRAGEADAPSRPGLLGAYHRQCIGCHQQLGQEVGAPVDCLGCHRRHTPDHRALVQGSGPATGRDATAQCLSCHLQSGREVRRSTHFFRHGRSQPVVGDRRQTPLGPATAGTDLASIDCLVCHDTSDRHRHSDGGLLDPGVDLAAVAARIGRPGRGNCAGCHIWSDGGSDVGHGDLEPLLIQPPADFDVHMGRADMRCQDCHTTVRHQIAGRSLSAPADEGRVTCERCHGGEPHRIAGLLGRHLDRHVAAVACVSCHVPLVARQSPTLIWLDRSQAGRDDPSPLQPDGGFAPEPRLGERPGEQQVPLSGALPDESQVNATLTTYNKRHGLMRWRRNLVPTYGWWDGSRIAHAAGDPIGSAPVILHAPAGDKSDPGSRIWPFQVYGAMQLYDRERRILATPELAAGYWSHSDGSRALADGVAEAGLEHTFQRDFIETRAYTALQHQVVPAERALGCADCHLAENVSCARCHRAATAIEHGPLARRNYPQVERFLDFGALAYDGDPALTGGRLSFSPDNGTPPP